MFRIKCLHVSSVRFTLETKKCAVPMDIVFILHSSIDIGDANLKRQIRFVGAVTSKLKVLPNWARIGVVMYSNNATVATTLGTYSNPESLAEIIGTLNLGGRTTNMTEALLVASFEIISRAEDEIQHTPKIIVMIVADKHSNNTNSSPPGMAAEDLFSQGINIFVVGIGPKVGKHELDVLVRDENELILAKDFTELVPRAGQLVTKICALTGG